MESLTGAWREMQGPNGRRLLLFGVAAAAIVAVWAFAHQMSAPTFVPLFRDLELKEAAAIGDQLRKSRIDHRLAAGGTEVQVPVAQAAAARVALAREGLPVNGRPGLELFDKSAWGMTDFTQRVTYQRALEGELARTIGAVAGVQQAQVHLVLPSGSSLRRLERPASASVVLTPRPGASLPAEAVQGIVYIVSNSVENLPPENVAVMDASGHVLSVPAHGAAGGGSRNLDLQRTFENQLVGRIEDLLSTVVGLGRVRAQVAARMSFDEVERTSESFDPDGQVIVNEQRHESGEEGTSSGQVVMNNSFQNSRKLERSLSPSGDVTRLTVAVLVDESAMRGSGKPTVDQLREMARDAAGIDSTRGDRLTVNVIPFEPVAAPAEGAASTARPAFDLLGALERLMRPLLALGAILALLLLALRTFGRPAPAAPGATPDAAAPAEATAGELARLRERYLAEPGPDATAQVLRSWLAERP